MARYFEGTLTAPAGRFAICVSRFNARVTEELLKGAIDALTRHGVSDDDIDVFRCPGAMELPGLARRVVGRGYAGVVCVGAVIRGGTPHFDQVCAMVTRGLGLLMMDAPCAVSFGVLTCDTVEQATERAGAKLGNKGADAAMACLEVANLNAQLEPSAHLKAMPGKKK